MAAHRVAAPNERVLIEQGLGMKRPSQIFVRANLDGSVVNNVRVGGHCVEVMRGEITL
jgi:predicted PhzF superfamily epimerase YddE/YHI9